MVNFDIRFRLQGRRCVYWNLVHVLYYMAYVTVIHGHIIIIKISLTVDDVLDIHQYMNYITRL